MQIGIIGLGRTGANMAQRLLRGGHQCVVFDKSPGAVAKLVQAKAAGATSLADLMQQMARPRTVWMAVPGLVVDELIAGLLPHLGPGDILIDSGNSPCADDIRRSVRASARAPKRNLPASCCPRSNPASAGAG